MQKLLSNVKRNGLNRVHELWGLAVGEKSSDADRAISVHMRAQRRRAGLLPLRFRRGKRLRIGWVVAACLILSGCSGIIASGPSEETAYLDSEVTPQIIEWGSGTAETFSFSSFAGARGYDKICLLDQYWSLGMIGKGSGPIDRYHSTFGSAVPENFLALVAIRNGVAHAALLHSPSVDIGAVPAKLCVTAESAVLRRIARPRETKPTAVLESHS